MKDVDETNEEFCNYEEERTIFDTLQDELITLLILDEDALLT